MLGAKRIENVNVTGTLGKRNLDLPIRPYWLSFGREGLPIAIYLLEQRRNLFDLFT